LEKLVARGDRVSGNPKALVMYAHRMPVSITQMKPVSSMRTFCKTARCPSSEMLLRYRRRYVTITERLSTEKHLRECDFCSAELQLLQRIQVEVEEPRVAEMPSNLRRLAENFLGRTRELSQIGLIARSPLSH
jgi:lipoate synthase